VGGRKCRRVRGVVGVRGVVSEPEGATHASLRPPLTTPWACCCCPQGDPPSSPLPSPSAAKLAAVFGTSSPNSPSTMRPAGWPPTLTSINTCAGPAAAAATAGGVLLQLAVCSGHGEQPGTQLTTHSSEQPGTPRTPPRTFCVTAASAAAFFSAASAGWGWLRLAAANAAAPPRVTPRREVQTSAAASEPSAAATALTAVTTRAVLGLWRRGGPLLVNGRAPAALLAGVVAQIMAVAVVREEEC
jgi:hypothetical protein